MVSFIPCQSTGGDILGERHYLLQQPSLAHGIQWLGRAGEATVRKLSFSSQLLTLRQFVTVCFRKLPSLRWFTFFSHGDVPRQFCYIPAGYYEVLVEGVASLKLEGKGQKIWACLMPTIHWGVTFFDSYLHIFLMGTVWKSKFMESKMVVQCCARVCSHHLDYICMIYIYIYILYSWLTIIYMCVCHVHYMSVFVRVFLHPIYPPVLLYGSLVQPRQVWAALVVRAALVRVAQSLQGPRNGGSIWGWYGDDTWLEYQS